MMILKSLASAFLMYSRIPMPQVEWKEENRRYALCFFPLIGAVIGGIFLFWNYLCDILNMGAIIKGVVSVVIPVIVTGGIHLDGFCDVIDAKSSFGDKEKKLSIMSDPHIGSFAAIYLVLYLLLQTAFCSEIREMKTAAVIALGFVMSRSLSGIGAVCLKSAKSGGTLQSFVKPAHRRITLAVLIAIAVISSLIMVYFSFFSGIFAVIGGVMSLVFYRFSAYRNFGGITGDTAGWFLQVCELVIAITALLGEKIAEVILI